MNVRIPRSPFSLSRRICVFLEFLSVLWKGRYVQLTNSNRLSYLHPNVHESVVLHLSDPGGTFHLALHLRLLNSEGSNQDVTLRNEVFLIVTGNVDHTKIVVILLVLLLALLHGYCKWHCLPFSVMPVTYSLDTSFACNVRCERFVLISNFQMKVRKI